MNLKKISDMEVIEILVSITHATPIYIFTRD